MIIHYFQIQKSKINLQLKIQNNSNQRKLVVSFVLIVNRHFNYFVMKQKKEIEKMLLLLAGAIAITLSGMNWNIGITAWIAPVFLLMYLRNTKWIQFLLFFFVISIAGMISQTGNNMSHQLSVNISNGISFGIFSSIAYIIDKILYKKDERFYFTLIFPSAVVVVEFALGFLMGTWGITAHSQYEIKPLLHLSSVTGVYGISFVVTWFAAVVNWIFEKKDDCPRNYRAILIYGGILCIVFLYGGLRIGFHSATGKTVKVAAVLSETNIHTIAESEKSTLEKLSENYNLDIPPRMFSDSGIIKTLVNRTEDASKQGARIIVWNEIALLLNQEQKRDLISEIQSLCANENVYVLLAFLEECPDANKKPFNNRSILVSPKGEIVWEYMKSFVHPTAEAPIINSGNFEIPVLQTEYGKIGNAICSDMDINNYIRQAGKQSADIMLVSAFDWEGITPLHSQMACLEAVQYGFSLVRANGKGLTAVYDYMGNTIASVNTLTSDTKIVYADVPTRAVKTFYSVFGNLIIYLSILFLLFLITKKIFKRISNV